VTLQAERQVDFAEIGARSDGEDPHACSVSKSEPPGCVVP
jgi:hypothetical protein